MDGYQRRSQKNLRIVELHVQYRYYYVHLSASWLHWEIRLIFAVMSCMSTSACSIKISCDSEPYLQEHCSTFCSKILTIVCRTFCQDKCFCITTVMDRFSIAIVMTCLEKPDHALLSMTIKMLLVTMGTMHVVQSEFGSIKETKLKKYVKEHHLTDCDEVDAVALVVSDLQSEKAYLQEREFLNFKKLRRALPPLLVIVTHASASADSSDTETNQILLVSRCWHNSLPWWFF